MSVVKDLLGRKKSTLVSQKVNTLGQALWRTLYRVFSPVDLLLIDSQGRRTGFHKQTGQVLSEIPGTTYTGPSSEPEAITFTGDVQPLTLIVTGNDTGKYGLEQFSLDDVAPTLFSTEKSTVVGKVELYRIIPSADGKPIFLEPGDIDADGDVDMYDLRLVQAALGRPASGINDLLDLNGDGWITGLDVSALVHRCTRQACASQ